MENLAGNKRRQSLAALVVKKLNAVARVLVGGFVAEVEVQKSAFAA